MSCYDERTMTVLFNGIVLCALPDTLLIAVRGHGLGNWLTACQAAHPSPPDIHKHRPEGVIFLERPSKCVSFGASAWGLLTRCRCNLSA